MPAFVSPVVSAFSLLFLAPRLRRWRIALAWSLFAAILVMGSVPGARADLGQVASGVILHTLAYGGISLLLYTGSSGTRTACALRTVLTVMAMGALDELVQSFLPYRSGALADWAIDVNAAVLTSALLWAFLPRPARLS